MLTVVLTKVPMKQIHDERRHQFHLWSNYNRGIRILIERERKFIRAFRHVIPLASIEYFCRCWTIFFWGTKSPDSSMFLRKENNFPIVYEQYFMCGYRFQSFFEWTFPRSYFCVPFIYHLLIMIYFTVIYILFQLLNCKDTPETQRGKECGC